MQHGPPYPEPCAGGEPGHSLGLSIEIPNAAENRSLRLGDIHTEPVQMVHTAGHQPFAARHVHGRAAAVDDGGFETGEASFDGGGQPGGTTADNQKIRSLRHSRLRQAQY